MIEPCLVDGANGVVVGLFAQVEPADFSADMLAERNDVEPGSGHLVMAGFSAIIGGLPPRFSFLRDRRRGGGRPPSVLAVAGRQGGETPRSPRAHAALNSTATRSRPPSTSLMKSMPSA